MGAPQYNSSCPPSHTIRLNPEGKFTLDYGQMSINFDFSGANVGCHFISAEAMDKLTTLWQEFRKPQYRKVIQ